MKQQTLVNVFHNCKRKKQTVEYELKIDVFEIALCKWCEWKCEIVVDGEKREETITHE